MLINVTLRWRMRMCLKLLVIAGFIEIEIEIATVNINIRNGVKHFAYIYYTDDCDLYRNYLRLCYLHWWDCICLQHWRTMLGFILHTLYLEPAMIFSSFFRSESAGKKWQHFKCRSLESIGNIAFIGLNEWSKSFWCPEIARLNQIQSVFLRRLKLTHNSESAIEVHPLEVHWSIEF